MKKKTISHNIYESKPWKANTNRPKSWNVLLGNCRNRIYAAIVFGIRNLLLLFGARCGCHSGRPLRSVCYTLNNRCSQMESKEYFRVSESVSVLWVNLKQNNWVGWQVLKFKVYFAYGLLYLIPAHVHPNFSIFFFFWSFCLFWFVYFEISFYGFGRTVVCIFIRSFDLSLTSTLTLYGELNAKIYCMSQLKWKDAKAHNW